MPRTSSQVFSWSWPTWARLRFILGGLLVVVLTLAGLVKLREVLKIRKLAKAQDGDPERASVTQRVRSSTEISFGANAMLRDPDVEGVSNSQASTPLQSPVLTPRKSSPSRLSLNLPSWSRRKSPGSSLRLFKLLDSGPNCTPRCESIALSPTEPTSAAGSSATPLNDSDQYRSWQNGRSHLDVQQQPMRCRRSVIIRAAPKQEPLSAHPTNEICVEQPLVPHQGRQSRVVTNLVPSTPTNERRRRTLVVISSAIDPAASQRTPTTKKALDRMEAHRRFHAAESGQLQPRIRNVEEKIPKHRHSTSDSMLVDDGNTRAVSWPITPGEVLVDFNAPKKVQTKTSPHVVPFRTFVEMHPPPKAPPKAPPSAWTDRTQGLVEEKLEIQTSKRGSTTKYNHADKTAGRLYTVTSVEDTKDANENFVLHGTPPKPCR